MTSRLANRYISILYRYGQRFFTQSLRARALPVEVGQLPALLQAYRHPGITQEAISAGTAMDKGTTARSLHQLQKNGLVLRLVDEHDHRINHIYTTAAAKAIEKEMFAVVQDFHAVLCEGFSEEEMEAALALLCRMKDNVSKKMEGK